MTSSGKNFGKRAGAALLVGTMLASWPAAALAQETTDPLAAQPEQTAPAETQPAEAQPAEAQPATQPAQAQTTQTAPNTAPVTAVIESIAVSGNQRLEPQTIRAYANLTPGQTYTTETLDAALKALYDTELFADVVITGGDTGNIVITVQENPVINRIVLEGNRRIKDDKILPEIRLAPRQMFTRSKVRADVERIIDLYQRQGRYAAQVEPKIVELDQNRVDLVFEIYEGPVSKIRQINIIGNEQYSDDRLKKEMFTREAGGLLGFLKSNDTYDPDRLAADQAKLRAFYLTEGYADFRVVSALAELTPDRQDFIITYVIEEGPRYRFGTVEAESALRDLPPEGILRIVNVESGDWFNAKAVEDSVVELNEVAGILGYAFSEINPSYDRDAENRVMNITFEVGETQRTYVERINIQGNTVTRDKVIRREFRLNEGDAFNAIKLRRSQDRIRSLGFFQEELEVKQSEGSAPDRVVLDLEVEEKPTGELALSAGYSSLERFILSASIAQRNFMGKGQQLNAGVNWSNYAKSVNLGFVEPYLFDRQILLGGEIYRRDYNSFRFIGEERDRTYSQISTGGGVRLGFPVTEFLTFGTRYNLVLDKITLAESLFFIDPDGEGPLEAECDFRRVGQYLCDELGSRVTSLLGYSVVYDNTDALRATRGQRLTLTQDFAGLGGDVRYLRTRGEGTKYWGIGGGWILSGHAEGGYIHPLQSSPGPGRDPIRITDRFFGQQMRGFDIRGIGPRVLRIPYDSDGNLLEEEDFVSDALGGRAYYMGRIELEVPTSASIRSLGLRPSAFIDIGSVFMLDQPELTNFLAICVPPTDSEEDPVTIFPGDAETDCPTNFTRSNGFAERYVGDSPSPRVSIGIGANWVSPFGPLRLDLAYPILKQDGDDTKIFSFNVGTRF